MLIPVLIGFSSCEKEEFDSPAKSEEINSESLAIIFNSTDEGRKTLTQTVLGNTRENPYTVKNIAEAKEDLYGEVINDQVASHYYVKFSPKDENDLIELEESNLFFFDFPMEKEVISMGDYYAVPEEGKMPELWTVVEAGSAFPNVVHEVVDELNLTESDPLLMHKAFERTNNEFEAEEYFNLSEAEKIETKESIDLLKELRSDCHPGCASWPCCLTGLLECYDDFVPNWCRNFDPDCYAGGPNYPECATGGGDGGFSLNSCGCRISSNRRNPGGCVQVEDTQLGLQGVKRVQVIAWNGWFRIDRTETNDSGCWQIERNYKGNAYFWVKFKSNRGRIRGVNNTWTAAWQWLTTVKDYVGQVSGPNFNNIQVRYNMYENQATQAHRFWGAATVNNALHEFHEYAIADGINTPPDGLDIHIGPYNGYGYAIMSVQNELSAAAGAAMGVASSFFAGPFAPVIAVLGWAGTLIYLPDVHIGVDSRESDDLKSLAYHEFAHASHYASVGREYWRKMVTATIFANGHGTQDSGNAELIAVVESWAEYIGGHVYVDRTYGSNFSTIRSWDNQLERTWNERTNHIPIGLFRDLADVGEPTIGTSGGITVTACNQREPGCTAIDDNVSGFTNAQLFSCLSPVTSTLGAYEECLIDNHLSSTPANLTQLTALFDSYFTN